MSDPKNSGKVADTKAHAKGARRIARREQVRVRIDKLRQSRQRSMFGLPELAGFAFSLLLLITAVFAYLYFLVPADMRLAALQRERTLLQEQLRGAQEGVARNTDAQATVEEINLSVERFERNRLSSRDEGRMSLYNALNQMIRSNALRNTSGPTYIALDALNTTAPGSRANAAANKPGVAKWQSLFPGIGVSVTVEGQYANLRRFMRDLEASNQFIVINDIELEKATNTDGSAAAAAAAGAMGEGAAVPGTQPRAAARGTLVSLRVDVAAYFRRDSTGEAEPTATETR
jgi:Tfp pilus assembly protein PilO